MAEGTAGKSKSKVVKDLAEEVVEDVVEELRELPEEIMELPRKVRLRKEWLIPAAIVGGVAAAGVGIGFAIQRFKKQKALVAELQDRDYHREREHRHAMAQVNARLGELRKQGVIVKTDDEDDEIKVHDNDDPTVEEFLAQQLTGDETDAPSDEAQSDGGRQNIFRNGEPVEEFDIVKEAANRDETKPYIISSDEYFDEEREYRNATLTYYVGDQVLCDEKNVPFYSEAEIDDVVGVANLRFGYGTNDPNAVYIRNNKLEVEYEVIRDSGRFDVEVLGHDVEDDLARDKPQVPKMRRE